MSLTAGIVAVNIPGAAAAPQAAGELDQSFGQDAVGITRSRSYGSAFQPTQKTIVDQQGRILVSGIASTEGGIDTYINRYLPDGRPDGNFNNFGDGFVRDITGGFDELDTHGVGVLTSGEIIQAAEYLVVPSGGTTNARVAISKLDPDGNPAGETVLGNPGGPLGASSGATGGELVALPDGKFLVSGSVPSATSDFARFFVVRYNPDLTVDTTFGTGGVSFADFGFRAVSQAVAVQPDGKILQSGHVRNGPHDPGVVRRLATGAIDTSFGAAGFKIWDTASGGDDWADSLAVRPDGLIAVSGQAFTGAVTSHVTVLNPDGSFSTGFGTAGVKTLGGPRSTDVAWDGQGRILVSLFAVPAAVSVARMTLSPAAFDPSFSGDGIASLPDCVDGQAAAVAVTNVNRIVIAGVCTIDESAPPTSSTTIPTPPALTNTIVVAQFIGEPNGWSGLYYSISPGAAPAGRAELDLANLDVQQLLSAATALQSAPLRGSPLRGSPLRGTPLRGSPLRGTPLRGTPLRGSPLRGSPLRGTGFPIPLPLSSIPLVQETAADPTWADILATGPYADSPLTNVTLQQVLALPVQTPDILANITFASIDLQSSPLRGSSFAAVMLANVPLSGLPAPTGGWCAFLAGKAVSCPTVDLTKWTMLDIELAGVDLTAYLDQPLLLAAVNITGSALAQVFVTDTNLSATPLGLIPSASAPAGVLTCGSTCPATLRAAQEANRANISATARLGTLIDALPVAGIADISLGQVLAGLIRAEDIPIEDLPLPPLLDRTAIRSTDVFDGQVTYDLECIVPERPVVQIALPTGARYVPGSVAVTNGDVPIPGPVSVAQTGQVVQFTVPSPCGVVAETRFMQVNFKFEPPVNLDLLGATTASLRTVKDSQTVVGGTEVFGEGEGGGSFLSEEIYSVDANEPEDDSEATATPIVAERLYTGHIGEASDVDLYSIPAPAPGSTLTLSLSHLPADYDLTVYGPDAGLETSPLRGSPLRGSPLRGTPVGDALDESGSSAATASPEGLADIPLRGSPLRGSSINRGVAGESTSIVATSVDLGKNYLVQVTGFDGATDFEPYVLRGRVLPGPAPAPCPAPPFLPIGPRDVPLPNVPVSSNTQTLFLVNETRMEDMYGEPAVTQMNGEFAALALSDPTIAVLPVDTNAAVTTAYAAWDNDPCSVAAANGVVNKINALVDGLRPTLTNLRHIVLVGSDQALPQARIPDLTRLSNQSDYTEFARFRDQDNAISRAFLEGQVLSDEPYGDFDPQQWLNGMLYVSDVGLGRLVESPVDVAEAISQYRAAGGVLNPSTGFVAGYDFLADGAEAVKASVAGATGASLSDSQINATWTADQAEAGIAAHNVNGLVSVNAHYDHFEALPAKPFFAGTTTDDQLLTTGELPSSLLGSILFTMGCEAGLNVPDVLVTSPVGEEVRSLNDWAQATADRGGLFAGNTGYGYGDTDAVAYSERVMANFAENLATKSMTAGQAMMLAKQRYNAELGVAGVYDAKAMEEATFYGLPMYRIGSTGGVGVPVLPIANPPAVTDSYTPEPYATDVAFGAPVTGSHGKHYEVRNLGATPVVEGPQVTHYRPIEPRFDVTVPRPAPAPAERIHGFVIEELTSFDDLNFDVAYGTPTIDLTANEPEAATKSTVFPAGLQAVSALPTAAGVVDKLVLMPGQFFADPNGSGLGTQRLFSHIGGQMTRSSSTDFDAPQIELVEAIEETWGGASLEVATNATDVQRGVVMYRLVDSAGNVEPTWYTKDLSFDPFSGLNRWTYFSDTEVPVGKRMANILVQLVDSAGNVGLANDKGTGHRSRQLLFGPPQLRVTPPIPPSGIVPVQPAISVVNGVGDYEVVVDGGDPQPMVGSFTVPGEGAHRVVVRSLINRESSVVEFTTDLGNPTVTITTPTNGATYPSGSVPAPVFSCSDAGSGIASCTPGPYLTTNGPHTFRVTAVDNAGRTAFAEVGYTVNNPYTFEGFFSPVDNLPVVNKTKASSTVPVKFRIRNAAGAVVSDPSVITGITSAVVSCSASAPTDVIEETLTTSTSALKFDTASQMFIYTWKTDKGWANTCRRLTVAIAGSPSQSAMFNFTK